MQPIYMIMIYYWDNRNGGNFLTRPVKNTSFKLETKYQYFFKNLYYINSQDIAIFFRVSCLSNKSLVSNIYFETVFIDFVSN